MKLTLNSLLALVLIAVLSAALKTALFIPFIAICLVILLGESLNDGIKNLLLILACTLVFTPLFIFFMFYLPFAIFGTLLSNPSFIKSYVLGLSIILVLRIALYYANMIGFPLTTWTILLSIALFLFVSFFLFIKKNSAQNAWSVFSIDSKDYRILLITLFFLILFAHVIYNNTSLYGSNGTQIYAKQKFVIDSIERYGFFPHYDPSIGMGEQLFLTDSPTHFTKDILILATIWLRPWFGEVLLYNAYSLFILWMVMLAASVLLREILSRDGKDNTDWTPYAVILGSAAVGLSFQFVRILESFKSFSAHPLNMLLFALILSKPKRAVEWFIIGYLMLFSFMVHAIQSIGVFILAISILVVMYFRDTSLFSSLFDYTKKHLLLGVSIAILFIVILLGYTLGGYFSSDYLRESPEGSGPFGLFQQQIIVRNMVDFTTGFFTNEGITPFSIHYPDLRRLDTKHSGFFLSIIGGMAFILCIILLKIPHLRKMGLFNIAFLLQFFAYDLITNTFNIGNLEPGYRIILPYTVVALAFSISALCDALPKKLKLGALIIFLGFFLHSSHYASINMANIHSSSIISKNSLGEEIRVVESLPLDGRFITYGLFSNEVDAGIASVTGKYFTRYQYNLWTSVNNIYDKVHTTESFGNFPELGNFSGLQLRNYWALGGYKYLFLNICHPAGNTVLQKSYPQYIQPLYQNQQNQCFIIARINDSEYVTTATVQLLVNESVYDTPDGYRYLSLSNLPRYQFDSSSLLLKNSVPVKQTILTFTRKSPQHVTIEGDFKPGEWVNFKEEYFFRWKAFINGEEQQIYPSNFNMMLIKITTKGSAIDLVYDVLLIEKFFDGMSLIACLSCMALFISLLRNPHLLE